MVLDSQNSALENPERTTPMALEHSLQDCQNYQNLRAGALPADTLETEKLNGPPTYSIWYMSELPEFLYERTTTKSNSESFLYICKPSLSLS